MTWKGGFSGTPLTIETVKANLAKVQPPRWIKRVAIHNTWKPDLAMWKKTPGGSGQRVRNLAHEFKNLQHWSGGPHWFVSPDKPEGYIFEGTPVTLQGTHSRGFNGNAIGIELAGDYTLGHDDDDFGDGLIVKDLGAQLTGALLDWLGLEANETTIVLHKEDPRTTHKTCPGSDLEKKEFVQRVAAWMAELPEAGEHEPTPEPATTVQWGRVSAPVGDPLNLRERSGLGGRITGRLPRGVILDVRNTATTESGSKWISVKTPLGYEGWVNARYVDILAERPVVAPPVAEPPAPVVTTAPAPSPVPAAPEPPEPATVPVLPPVLEPPAPHPADEQDGGPQEAIAILIDPTGTAWPRHWAQGSIGNQMRESFPDLRPDVWGDKINGNYTAYGLGQWRLERLEGLEKFAKARGTTKASFKSQVLWIPQELKTSEKLAWKWLQKSENVEQATAAMVLYERPRGYSSKKARAAETWPQLMAVAEKCDGWDKRLEFARSI